ncbi:LysR family transcriptional regulator [Pandoraea pulmonicola]|uniref:LysR family transcriptional regulator n=1 Tax=Pandoraea pulmonicola TaxID=93221 RepID=A0AAJ5D1T5_PANPU|nr:LysR family transcriptional regulator [Pandoraea pulmonicola]AJC19925.1 LysR family transcriptional regulator [Pandoraea pulmonicola]SUA91850.1 Nodulation protein D 2 [Pandoraea pulmonicola]
MKRQSWTSVDLNLLKAFSVLVSELSVAAAARRLNLSESAMSRTLGRVREAFGDPVLVRAGRSLVPTPRALSLQAKVNEMLEAAQEIFRADEPPNPAALERTFTIQCNEGFVVEFGAKLLGIVRASAPKVRLRFVTQREKSAEALREDFADVEIGVLGRSGPEIRLKTLLRDRFVGVVAPDHALAKRGHVSVSDYVSHEHVSVSRRGLVDGPIDNALRENDVVRDIAAVVSSFPAALAMARDSELIANVPFRQTAFARKGMHTFELPFETPQVVVSMMWHPKVDADAAHRWLRDCLQLACEE